MIQVPTKLSIKIYKVFAITFYTLREPRILFYITRTLICESGCYILFFSFDSVKGIIFYYVSEPLFWEKRCFVFENKYGTIPTKLDIRIISVCYFVLHYL